MYCSCPDPHFVAFGDRRLARKSRDERRLLRDQEIIVRWIGVGFLWTFAALVPANLVAGDMSGYSTVMRVEFVLECMRDHPGSQYEMMNKCSCVLDQLAKHYTADAFVEARTTTQAITIAGERGAVLRDNEEAHRLASDYRDFLARAQSDCFLRPPIEE